MKRSSARISASAGVGIGMNAILHALLGASNVQLS